MSSITTTTRDFGSCLACGKPLIAIIEVRVFDVHLDGTDGTANVEVVGTYVSHDCRTKATDEPTTDEWVEVDEAVWSDQPNGTRVRREWATGSPTRARLFVHRDDLPDEGDER